MNKYIKLARTSYYNVYTVFNKRSNDVIGYVAPYPHPDGEASLSTPNIPTTWNVDCLNYIADFIKREYADLKDHNPIKFIEQESKGKTFIFNSTKGTIKWHAPWRQYCWLPPHEAIVHHHEILQIINFITVIKLQRK